MIAQTARISRRSDSIMHRRSERMRLLNEGFAKLRLDKKAWQEELEEREKLEGTLSDGLENRSTPF